ncbi:MAG: DapH/DapD/GlmU-related protein [Pseudomonadota bacterium]
MSNLRELILDDAYRNNGRRSYKEVIKLFLLTGGFRYLTLFRLCQRLKTKKLLKAIFYVPTRICLHFVGIRYGIEIPVKTTVGKGFYIGHHGNIIVHAESVIGDNCNISQGVTLGRASRGKRRGAPSIGDNVYLGPSCIVSGNVSIGDNAVIGAGAIVNFDVAENSVVASPRAVVISNVGSEGYVNRKV